MPRPCRVNIEGGVYHVYNRLARGERAFDEERQAEMFVRFLREVVRRDGLTVFAWCLMSNHYHLAVQTGVVSLDRPMRSLQQRVTHRVNQRRRVSGPLWQGRYRAKLVESQRYLDQLLVYIHLNPVAVGVVDDPAKYPWSGHHELLGSARQPIINVDGVLRLFGATRRSARAAYARRLRVAAGEKWIGEEPGRLPWWLRRGPHETCDEEDPEEAVRRRRKSESQGPEWRPRLTAGEFIVLGAKLLGVAVEDLRSRRRTPELVQARGLLAMVGVERYGLKLKVLATELGKSPDGMTKAVARVAQRRTDDGEFRCDADELDSALSRAAK